jgi:hypothetical protein
MNEKDGGPAFPFEYDDAQFGKMAHTGMTLRDWFAGMVIQGMSTLEDGRTPHREEDKKDIEAWRDRLLLDDAKAAYRQADAMLKSRE